jgi:hypothetical protein
MSVMFIGILAGSVFSTSAPSTPVFTISNQIKHIGIVPLQFKLYHLTSGNVDEYSNDKTIAAKNILTPSILKTLARQGFEPRALRQSEIDSCVDPEVFDLYRTVESAMQSHVFGGAPFEKRIVAFDYTVGPIDSACARLGVDALLIIEGFDEDKTEARHKFMYGEAGGSFTGMLPAFGSSAVTLPEDRTLMTAVLIDRSGTIIWYKYFTERDDRSLTQTEDVRYVIEVLLNTCRPSTGGDL